jgi:hypothetical protein
MTIFVVMAREPNPELESRIASSYPSAYQRFADRIWFAAGVGTARGVAAKLDVRNDGITGVIVIPITGDHYGVANAGLWNWMRSATDRLSRL